MAYRETPDQGDAKVSGRGLDERPATGSHNHEDARHEVLNSEKDIEAGSTTATTTDEPQDPDVVDWDGPEDPQNPMNWSSNNKVVAVGLVSAFTFITPFASSVFAPAIDQVMEEFNSTNPEVASFIVSVYLLGYVFGPLAIAPLSETYGRAPVYHINNVFFVVLSVACALAPNLGALIVFRLFAGIAGSCPVTIGAGTIADLIPKERRGAAMAAWLLGPLFGPIVGPIAGGYLTQAKDWRWTFWLVAMIAGAIAVPSLVFLRETYAPVILERKTQRLRKETGNLKLRSKLDTGLTRRESLKLAIVRPTKMLVFSPILFLMALYMAVIYGDLYVLITGMSYVFSVQYGFGPGSVGLTFLGIGVGSLIALVLTAVLLDRMGQALAKRNGEEMIPGHRLPLGVLGGVLVPVGLFWFGWTADKQTHYILPIIGGGWLGLGTVLAMISVQTYLVDAFTEYAASAAAANTVLRSLVGALLPLGGRKLFENLGIGWGSSLLGFIGLATIPVPVLFYLYGERIRHKTFFNVKF